MMANTARRAQGKAQLGKGREGAPRGRRDDFPCSRGTGLAAHAVPAGGLGGRLTAWCFPFDQPVCCYRDFRAGKRRSGTLQLLRLSGS